jgi:hypothetical protein
MLERKEAKMDVNQEKTDDGQEEIKTQVVYLAYQTDINQEEKRASISAIQYKIDS